MKPNDMSSLTCACGRPSEHESGLCMACVYKAQVETLQEQLKHCRESRADDGLSAMEELVELRSDIERLTKERDAAVAKEADTWANWETRVADLKEQIRELSTSCKTANSQVEATLRERDEEAALREKYWLEMESWRILATRANERREAEQADAARLREIIKRAIPTLEDEVERTRQSVADWPKDPNGPPALAADEQLLALARAVLAGGES